MKVWVRVILYTFMYLIYFYTILDTFMRFPLLYDSEHSYTILS